MRGRVSVSLGIGVLLMLVVAPSTDRTASTVNACWDISPYPMFFSTQTPEDRRFYSGALGILRPTYRRSVLVAAWRTLAGRPLVDAERRAYVPDPSAAAHPSARDVWLNARKTVSGLGFSNSIWQETFLAPSYSYILNCGDSALETAARTLDARRVSLGASNPEFTAWVAAQDLVFRNCARQSGQSLAIPEPLGPGASRLAQADRAYQIAAARFYAGQYTDAETGFAAIGRDTQSPWRHFGPYLAARAMIRQATLGGNDATGDPAAAARARAALKAVIADPASSDLHNSAEGLLQYLDARTDPVGALETAAAAIESPESDSERFAAHLNDFRILMDRFWTSFNPEPGLPALDPARDSSELVDWIMTLQVADDRHAIARWEATRSPAWLVAALMKLEPGDAKQADLLSAAATVPAGSPAYLTLAFNRARLLLLSGDQAQARDVLGRALASPDLPASTANQLKAARMLSARTLDEFLQDAVRTPILEQGAGAPALDDDSIDVLNEQIPLALLRDIGNGHALPKMARVDILRAVLTRAVLLQDAQAVRQSIDPLMKSQPDLRAALAPLTAAATDDVLMNEATLLLLAHPGLRPFMPGGSFRRTGYDFTRSESRPLPLTAIDTLRDNWWCSFAPAPTGGVPYETSFNHRGYARLEPVMAAFRPRPKEPDRVAFLTDAQRRQAADEWTALQKIDAAPNELGRWATQWVEAHPTDPRAPKILYQVVRATRYGCTNERTGAISHRAFTLLHRRYPHSEWAKKTPFWFN
jgi:hypothetical protein